MNRENSAPKRALAVENFRDDPMFPRIEAAVLEILSRGHVVAPVDVFVAIGLLSKNHLQDWRLGRIPHLEAVIGCNLTKASRLLRVLRFFAHDLNLSPSQTAYHKFGEGHFPLRFTKTGEPKIEEAWSRHYVWIGRKPFVLRGVSVDGQTEPKAT